MAHTTSLYSRNTFGTQDGKSDATHYANIVRTCRSRPVPPSSAPAARWSSTARCAQWLLLSFVAFSCEVSAQHFRVSTVAGAGTFGGDGGPATSARIFPYAITFDSTGNMYLADASNHIRKVATSGVVTTIAGNGDGAFYGDGGPATAAALNAPLSVAVDTAGNVYVADSGNARVRRITTNGTIQTVVGNGGCPIGGASSVATGTLATAAPFCDMESVAVDPAGVLYFAAESRVWKVAANGTVVLVAGTGGGGNTGDAGPATGAQIGYPESLAIDTAGNIYIADDYNFVVRKVAAGSQLISTVPTQINSTSAPSLFIALDAFGTLYYTATNTTFRKITAGVDTLAGTIPPPFDSFSAAGPITLNPAGVLHVALTYTDRVLKFAGGPPVNVAGSYPLVLDPDGPALGTHLQQNSLIAGIAIGPNDTVYFAELDKALNQRIAKIAPPGTVTTVLSQSTVLPGTTGSFTAQAIAFDATGNMYFSTFTQVYKRATDGTLTLYAGVPGFSSSQGDGGPATAATLTSPSALALDSSGNLYIADPFNSRVRKVDAATGIITTFAGTGSAGNSGNGGQASAARLSTPVDLAVDSSGNLYIVDLTAAVIRKVAPNGIISTIAGSGSYGYSGDGGLATAAQFAAPASIAVDPTGNIYVLERNNGGATIIPIADPERIRKIDTSGIITTIAGTGGRGIYANECEPVLLDDPTSIRSDSHGNIYFGEAGSERIRKLTPAGTPSCNLTVPSVNGGTNPTAGAAFNVAVQVKGQASTAQNVVTNTVVTLSLIGGTGTLGGTLSCTVPAGSIGCTVVGATYSKAESGVTLRVTSTTGDALGPGTSSPFAVDAAAQAAASISVPTLSDWSRVVLGLLIGVIGIFGDNARRHGRLGSRRLR